MAIDFRACLYALSDVVINRPPPLRHVDQIYMKLPDMLLQAEFIGRWFDLLFPRHPPYQAARSSRRSAAATISCSVDPGRRAARIS